MFITSDAYKAEQKQDLREKSYVFVNIGIINQNARDKATVESGLTDYSNIDSAFRKKDTSTIGQYATLEEGFTRVDEANAFLPRNADFYDDTQGLVCAALNSAIIITFPDLVDVDIKGLTIDFGDSYPTEFTVSNGTVTKTYTKEDSALFTCEDQYDNCEYLEITPISMVGGEQRLRILSMDFGVGLSFGNDQLISTQRRNTVSHISEALPLKAFDFTVDNLSRKFSQDNPYSFAHYIEEGQPVEFKYGREIIDDEEQGTSHIEYIDGGKTYIKTWSSNDLSAKFSTVGRLDMMDNEYYKGTYYKDEHSWRSAYQVASDVLWDAGLTADDYFLSDYLNAVAMCNPLPIATHKACLQMIANATKSVLFEDRQGRICIQSSFVPTVTESDIQDEYDDYIYDEAFQKNEATYDWATLEEGFTKVDNTMYFKPRDSHISTLEMNPGILSYRLGELAFVILFDAAWTFNGVEMEFSEILPTECILIGYREEEEVDRVEFVPTEMHTRIEHVFNDIEDLEVILRQDTPGGAIVTEFGDCLIDEDGVNLYYAHGAVSRVHLRHFIFTADTGHTITNMDLANKPTATSIDKIKAINVNYYNYSHGTEVKQLTSVEVTADDVNIIKLANAAENYTVLWEGADGETKLEEWSESKTYSLSDHCKHNGIEYNCNANTSTGQEPGTAATASIWLAVTPSDVTILLSGSYFVEVEVTQSHGKLQVYGVPMDVNYSTYSRQMHDVGNVKNLNNVLISNADENELGSAVDIANWIYDYYSNDTEYTIQYRGEPALDCDDLVYLENQFVNNNLCRIEEEEINTSVGMSLTNSMKLRRISYTT